MEQRVIPISFGMVKAFLVKREKCVLVDTGLPEKLNVILEELKKNNINPEDISLIVATHNHADHVGEIAALKELTKGKIAIHKSEASGPRDRKTTETKPITLLGRTIRKLFKSSPLRRISPDIVIEDELQLKQF